MNITLNGIVNDEFLDFEKKYESQEIKSNHYFKLRDMKVNYCQGCWDCWVKTPGECAFNDDFVQVLAKVPSADTLTIITPIIVGYESALIKTAKDRMIALIHPYIKMYKGEQHHRKRYDKSPDFKLIILKDDYSTIEDVQLLKEVYNRVALNFHSKVIEFSVVEKGEVELCQC